MHWIEPAGIASYAAAHQTFPHETTTDQWFTESQFESYRSLGFEIAERILKKQDIKIRLADQPGITLQQLLVELSETTRAT